MKYDPIKRTLGGVFNRSVAGRKFFYRLLDLLLLRAWHVHVELKKWGKTVPADADVLDAGAGFGQYVYYMSHKFPGWKILGVDVKDEQVEDCNHFFGRLGKNNIRFMVGDLTRYRKENAYHLILSVDVMEHIEEDVQVFRNFHASLKKDGMLLISTPSDQGGSDVHDHDHEDENGSFIDEHVRDGYNIAEIREKLEIAGFKRISTKYVYGTPGKISWKLSMKYPLLMLNASKLFFIVLPFYYLLTFPFSYILNWADVLTRHKTGTGLIVTAYK